MSDHHVAQQLIKKKQNRTTRIFTHKKPQSSTVQPIGNFSQMWHRVGRGVVQFRAWIPEYCRSFQTFRRDFSPGGGTSCSKWKVTARKRNRKMRRTPEMKRNYKWEGERKKLGEKIPSIAMGSSEQFSTGTWLSLGDLWGCALQAQSTLLGNWKNEIEDSGNDFHFRTNQQNVKKNSDEFHWKVTLTQSRIRSRFSSKPHSPSK